MPQAPLKKKGEMKLLILYVMKKISYPLDYMTLNEISTTDGFIDGFEFAECFAELLDAGNITEFKDDSGEDVYVLTDTGSRVIENLEGDLLSGIREQVYKTAIALMDFRLSGRRVTSEVKRDEADRPVFTGTVEDATGVLFSVTAQLETEDQLQRVEMTWEKHPEHIYKSLLALLSGDAEYLM